MNPGQKMFYDFFIARTIDGKQDEAAALLEAGFARQEAGTFSKEYLEEVMPKYFALIRPEAVDELKEAMAHFGSRL